jgi:hypothetical protein
VSVLHCDAFVSVVFGADSQQHIIHSFSRSQAGTKLLSAQIAPRRNIRGSHGDVVEVEITRCHFLALKTVCRGSSNRGSRDRRLFFLRYVAEQSTPEMRECKSVLRVRCWRFLDLVVPKRTTLLFLILWDCSNSFLVRYISSRTAKRLMCSGDHCREREIWRSIVLHSHYYARIDLGYLEN